VDASGRGVRTPPRKSGEDRERDREVRECAPAALEVLLVAELGEPPRVVVLVTFDRLLGSGHSLPLRRKGLLLRPSGGRAYGSGPRPSRGGQQPCKHVLGAVQV